MNALQKVLIQWIIERYPDRSEIVREIKNTFTVKGLCDMMGINRNRYYYLIRTGQLSKTISEKLIQPIVREVIENETKSE